MILWLRTYGLPVIFYLDHSLDIVKLEKNFANFKGLLVTELGSRVIENYEIFCSLRFHNFVKK